MISLNTKPNDVPINVEFTVRQQRVPADDVISQRVTLRLTETRPVRNAYVKQPHTPLRSHYVRIGRRIRPSTAYGNSVKMISGYTQLMGI